jgi:hypothetical protein
MMMGLASVQSGFAHRFAQKLRNYLTHFVKRYNIFCLTVKQTKRKKYTEKNKEFTF